MNMTKLRRALDSFAFYADFLQAPLAFATRLYVSHVFLWSGWLKLKDWEQTVGLFEVEYQVPLLPPLSAAVAGTAGELAFSIFLILGFGGRVPALGLFFVNLVAVISSWHIFSTDVGVAGLRQHYLWGFMLGMLIVYGSGTWSLDHLLSRRNNS